MTRGHEIQATTVEVTPHCRAPSDTSSPDCSLLRLLLLAAVDRWQETNALELITDRTKCADCVGAEYFLKARDFVRALRLDGTMHSFVRKFRDEQKQWKSHLGQHAGAGGPPRREAVSTTCHEAGDRQTGRGVYALCARGPVAEFAGISRNFAGCNIPC